MRRRSWRRPRPTPMATSRSRTGAARDKDAVLYLVAKGGEAAAGKRGDDPALALLAVLGSSPPAAVTVNELTTVASAYTAARFIDGEAISGNPLGLRIAAGNVPNLVDPATGGWGKVLLDPLNSTQTTTLANLDTLGSLISAFATVADDAWRARFLEAAAPTAARPRRTRSRPWPASPARHGPSRRSCSRCSRRPTRSRRIGARRKAPFAALSHLCPVRFRPVSSGSPAAGRWPRASSSSTPTAISGAGRTGCRGPSPASPAISAAARSSSPRTARRCRPRSPALPAWAWTGSAGVRACRATRSGSAA